MLREGDCFGTNMQFRWTCSQLMALILLMNSVHDVDWNLWLVLDLLLETGSVTATAKRLRRTQSAVSHSLASLRTIFSDPLFIRVGPRFEPTPRARALAEPVRAMVQTATRALASPAVFDVLTLRRTFRLLLSDYAQVVLLPGLLKRLSTQAPGVTLDVQFRSDTLAANLADVAAGKLDLTVYPMGDAPSGILRQRLFDDRNVCVLREGHPALERFTPARFAALAHVQVSARGLGPDFVDHALARKKLKRHIALRVPHFATAPHLVATTDAVAVVPERIALAWRKGSRVTFVESPVALPSVTMAQYSPELLRHDPGHAWLRRAMLDAAVG